VTSKRLPISACVIVKDDPLLEQAIRSIRDHVQEIIVVRTATDVGDLHSPRYAGLIDKLSYGDPFIDKEIDDFSFSLARNKALSLATQPWWMWLDSDDVVRDPAVLEPLLSDPHSTASFIFPYEYGYVGEPGKSAVSILLERERLFKNPRAWEWIAPVHEVAVVKAGYSHRGDVRQKAPVWEHHKKDSTEGSKRNLRILGKYIEKHPDDVRMLFYYASELKDASRFEESVKVFDRYLAFPTWEDERAVAAIRAVGAMCALGKFEEALPYAWKAVESRPEWGEGYWAAADIYFNLATIGGPYERRNYERSVYWAKKGLEKPPTQSMMFTSPVERHYVFERLALASCKIGDVRGALESGEAALRFKDNSNVRFNIDLYKSWLLKNEIIEKINDLTSMWSSGRHHIVDQTILDTAQVVCEALKPRTAAATKSDPKRGPLDIVIACGDAWEVWNPETAAIAGIGGSETAVIEMAKRLVRLGHRVRVYTSCGAAKIYDGVEYRPTADMANGNTCDLLIAWRYAAYLGSFAAKQKWLWIHDVYAVGATRENLTKADRILVLSEWHKRFVLEYHAQHGIDSEKVFITSNGIDLARFEQIGIVRDPHKVVYSSSPDRGLEQLLEMWPEIVRRVSDASLHIFYSFSNWEKSDPTSAHMARVKALIEANKDRGVHYHGRVDQMRLAREFLTAWAWLYPSWVNDRPFYETYAITRIEALAAGLAIVTSPVGALETSTGFEDYVVGDARTPAYQAEFVDASVHALTSEIDREERMKYARDNFSWDRVAAQWNEWMGGNLDDRPILHMVLSKDGVVGMGGPPIDPEHPFDTTGGGGSRVGFMGLARAMATHRRVIAYSYFSKEGRFAGIEHRQIEKFDPGSFSRNDLGSSVSRPESFQSSDAVLAYYDTRPLAAVPAGTAKRVASHHSYKSFIESHNLSDIDVAPSIHAMQYLRRHYLPQGNWSVMPNGVGERPVTRNPVPGRIIHHASPDRGLHLLVEAFPEILKRVPHATLHVVGWVHEWTTGSIRSGLHRDRAERLQRAIEMCPSGLTILGSLPFSDLMRELGEASVFAFPCDLLGMCETFSISVMECCKIGLPVVLSPADALESVYRGTVAMVPSPAEEHMDEFVDEVVRVLTRDDYRQELSDRGRRLAQEFTFEREAEVLATLLDEPPRETIQAPGVSVFEIPKEPANTREHAQWICKQVFGGEYDHAELPKDGIRTVVDIGSHVGAFPVWAKAKWPEIEAFDCYDPNVKANVIAARNVAFCGSVRIHGVAITTDANPKYLLPWDWGSAKTHGIADGVSVPAMHPRDLPAVDLLKCDAEGIEPEVLTEYRHWDGLKVLLYEFHYPAHREILWEIATRRGFRNLSQATGDYGVSIWMPR
jgi:glycosyltransferase involved in cell wall biosynthesis